MLRVTLKRSVTVNGVFVAASMEEEGVKERGEENEYALNIMLCNLWLTRCLGIDHPDLNNRPTDKQLSSLEALSPLRWLGDIPSTPNLYKTELIISFRGLTNRPTDRQLSSLEGLSPLR
jgi:hypothetical protein